MRMKMIAGEVVTPTWIRCMGEPQWKQSSNHMGR